ncbi:arabinosyltransferase domain-containing protein [Pseudonocardia ailaonensis]|uniref:Arabinosyltransferase domain-containing protein n=1 Tax=Pseudonocardia ailaonensis TaxID=367279 RepID=A0ABN2NJW0_9PSEU
MLTTDTVAVRSPDAPAPPHPARGPRRLAAALGLLSAVLSIAIPFLPVSQNTAELSWPTATAGTAPVTAPLVTLRPESFDATIACPTLRSLDARGPATVFTTTAPGAPDGATVGMRVGIDGGLLTVDDRGRRLAESPLPAGDCTLVVRSDATSTTVTLGGTRLSGSTEDLRPQVVGLWSDLDQARDPVAGTVIRFATDNRFDSAPSWTKIAAGALAVVALLGCLLVLRRLDDRDGRRMVHTGRLSGRLRGHDWLRDSAVVALLAGATVFGSMTPDDGYILTIARGVETSGYIGNYYRWFDVPEAPFGWFYELYSRWIGVSDAVLWLRIPALAMGVASWLLISRGLLPRLGTRVRRSRSAGWAAAGVFLCFWIPFDNGLRPEPVVVIAALLSLVLLERALVTQRLVPIAFALVSGAFAVAATPTGLIAFAPLLAAGRPLLRLLSRRAKASGWLPVLLPLVAAGVVVLVAVFDDQTWSTIAEATRVRTEIGPNQPWYQELSRYDLLFSDTRDGSLMRRFPVLLLILCLIVSTAVLLRRKRIPGAALGVSRRLIGSSVLGFVVLALTPTKWTHHFGAFAALGAGMAALAALATGTSVLRSRRNQAILVAGLLGITAFAFAGPNTWWYVSNWGVPWFDKPPSVRGISATSLLLLAAALTLVYALVEHLRGPVIPRPVTFSRAPRLNNAPIAAFCALMVLFQIAGLAKSVQKQWGSYSLAGDIVSDPTGSRCGLAGRILVETDPERGLLPVTTGPGLPGDSSGFTPDGLPPDGAGSLRDTDGQGNHDPGVTGTGPHGPVTGSWSPDLQATGDYRSPWYALPQAARDGAAPLVLGVAGQIGSGTSVTLQFSRGGEVIDTVEPSGSGGAVTATSDPTGTGSAGQGWRDVRLNLAGTTAATADAVRVIARDRALGQAGWVAVTAPRVPQLTPLTQVVAGTTGYLDWPTAFPSPCLQPFGIHRGVAELPGYRILADPQQRAVGDAWGSPSTGGPQGWMDQLVRQRVLPTYLQGQWDFDWGQLRMLEPYAPAGAPDVEKGLRTMWGWQQEGPIGGPPTDPPLDRP